MLVLSWLVRGERGVNCKTGQYAQNVAFKKLKANSEYHNGDLWRNLLQTRTGFASQILK